MRVGNTRREHAVLGLQSNRKLGFASIGVLCYGTPCAGVPTRLTAAPRFVALSAALGQGLTCGLTASGDAYCWGFGLGGQLGNGQRQNSSAPVAVAGGLKFQLLRVAPSSLGACGQTADRSTYCWGPLGLLYGNSQSGEGHDTPTLVNWGRRWSTLIWATLTLARFLPLVRSLLGQQLLWTARPWLGRGNRGCQPGDAHGKSPA